MESSRKAAGGYRRGGSPTGLCWHRQCVSLQLCISCSNLHEPCKMVSVLRSSAAVPGSAVGQLIFFSASFAFGMLPPLLFSEHDLSLTLMAVPSSASEAAYQLPVYQFFIPSLFVDEIKVRLKTMINITIGYFYLSGSHVTCCMSNQQPGRPQDWAT